MVSGGTEIVLVGYDEPQTEKTEMCSSGKDSHGPDTSRRIGVRIHQRGPDNQIGIEIKNEAFGVMLASKCASVVYFSL